MKKKKNDFSILINILFILIFVGAGLFVYFACGAKDASTIVKEMETQIQEEKHPVSTISEPEQVPAPEQTDKNIPPFKKYHFKYSYFIDVQGQLNNLELEVPLPADEREKQYITNFKTSIKPARLYNDGGNTIADFIFENPSTGKYNVIIEGIANVRTYNIKTASQINKNYSSERNLGRYLQPEDLIESNDIFIKNIADSITGNTRTEILQNIYEYIQKNMNYKIIRQNLGAKKALQQKYGKCTEYSAIMIALCRAKNIPARFVIGNIAREQITQHNWVEVWFDEYGWVAYDPTVRTTLVNIYDTKGKLLKQEKRYDTSNENMRYIASGRNITSPFKMRYSVLSSASGSAAISEQIEIKEI